MTPAAREYQTARENLDPVSIPRQERAAISDRYASSPDVDRPFFPPLTDEEVKAYWRAKHLADDWGMAVDGIGDAINRMNESMRFQATFRSSKSECLAFMRGACDFLAIMLAEATLKQLEAGKAIPSFQGRDV